jgi:hypothetical protein
MGNPPYITVKDKAISELYRMRYFSCHRQYSLSVPFMERFFDLAVKGDGAPQHPAGFVGQITSNSFMKREFGKKLVEEFVPRWDLTHVLDTAGAYIPGHGTPTVILFGKNQPPVGDTIRAVLGIRGEPATPADPASGIVWQAILKQIDMPGSESEWVSSVDAPCMGFHRHPWSIGGGGAAGLKEAIEDGGASTVESASEWPIGRAVRIGEEEAFIFDAVRLRHSRIDEAQFRPYLIGENVREWSSSTDTWVWYPYCPESTTSDMLRQLWPWRTTLENRTTFQGKLRDTGQDWFGYQQHTASAYARPLSIAFAFVATHNHFVLDRGGKVFKQSSPVIKLKPAATEEQHILLLGVLNSSLACFWLKQVAHNKGSTVDQKGARQRTAAFEDFYEFTATQMASFPVPGYQPSELPNFLVTFSTKMQALTPVVSLTDWTGSGRTNLDADMSDARNLWTSIRCKLIAWQEEMDWQIYEAFGLVEMRDTVSLPDGKAAQAIPLDGIELGQRAFEIVLARRMAAGEAQTTWFERHGSTPITDLPGDWPTEYRELIERRIARIESDPNIRLIEQPEYKRRWNTEPWNEQFTKAARIWLLARLESYFFEGNRVCNILGTFGPASHGFTAATRPHLASANQLADVAQTDKLFLEVAESYVGSSGFSVPKLVRELVEAASVPYLPVQRYKDSGLRKRQDWEHVWGLQREEDAIDAAGKVDEPGISDVERVRRKAAATTRKKAEIGDISVPPKYVGPDFAKATYWKLRGKLDVPKERWISYPGAERAGDDSLVIAWAGWDHLQQAQALAEYYLDAKDNQGWQPDRLKPLLAGLADLIPWLKQWHNESDPSLGMGLGDYFAGFLEEQCRGLGFTVESVEKARFA